ncbi:MAG: anion permease [Coriobacteriales bacterium]|nr:anion permease [Coriobacteriales bacterium]
MTLKKWIGAILAVASIVITQFIPGNDVLTVAGFKTIGLLLAFLFMLVFEVLPVVVTSLIFCGLMPVLGVVEGLGAAITGFSQPIVFFILASFGIAAAMTAIPLSRRILRLMLRKFGRNISSVLLGMMIAAAVFSSVVSNIPTCAIFMTLSLDFIELYEHEEERRRSGRAFMIAIPVASMIGGVMTPAGSSVNLIAISQLEQATGMTISFFNWMLAGIPIAIILLPLAWWLMCKIYKPVQVSKEAVQSFAESLGVPDKMDKQEKKVVVIILIMLVLWIASSWVSQINVMVVALLGCCVMFLPGIHVLELETFLKENSWDAFFLVGCVLSISSAMINNGVSAAIANAIPAFSASSFVFIAFVCALIFIVLIIIPVAPSMIPIMAVPIIAVATTAGVSPTLAMLAAGICAYNCYLLPLDTVPLITYSKGYYSMTDMAKSTIFLQIACIILCAVWLPLIGGLVGIA